LHQCYVSRSPAPGKAVPIGGVPHVCVVDVDGRKIGAQCVDSTPGTIAAALSQYGPIERAVIETGRMTPSIALGLRELGVAIVCIDARQAHHSMKAMKANKTDPHDAAGLAQLARSGYYKEVHVKSPAAHGIRAVITARRHLVEARVRLDKTIRGLCATFGIRLGIGQGERFLARMQAASERPGSRSPAASLSSCMPCCMTALCSKHQIR
jgi:transposase